MATTDRREGAFEDFGINASLVDLLYEQWRADPSSVNEEWRAFFAADGRTGDGHAGGGPGAAAPAPPLPPPLPPEPAPRARERAPHPPEPDVAATPAPAPAVGPEPVVEAEPAMREVLRGAAARVVENMETSLEVPTATSVRVVPAKLLEVNRELLNDHLTRQGAGKASFTHLIAYAVIRAAADFPGLNSSFTVEDGAPVVIRHPHLNLGLAVDVRRRDGSRGLVVPNIKRADTLTFAEFRRAYEELIARVHQGRITVDDLTGTTATITNPGMLGTVQSIPRLMAGQGFIVGVGTIGPPAQYAAVDPRTLADLGISSVVTITNTYDHRIISGAESGEFLGRVEALLLGEDGFYDDVFRSEGVASEPARWARDRRAHDDRDEVATKVVRVHQLINLYRVRGHLLANLDPLGRDAPPTHPELDLAHHGLTVWDLDRTFPVDTLGEPEPTSLTLREILQRLRAAYAGTVGVEYMHIQDPVQKEWIQRRVERPPDPLSPEEQRRILDRLVAAEALERFLHTKYLGHKRFSLEGAEVLIPMLDQLCSDAADAGARRVVLGMAHRGRLNVLANILGKPYRDIFLQFEGDLDPSVPHGSGDVKYHLGATGTHVAPSGREIELTLAANPSHLESVDPVVLGMARAVGDRLGDTTGSAALPILIHGDAAFAGQGVVAETLNLSDVPGYDVGGAVHIVVNNQLGFTTGPEAGRSSVYATDVAKAVQAPIFHVNADDAEAAWRTIRLAFAFRQEFRKDVVVDLVCYRRYGHNEADEPAYTQPTMYRLIAEHPSVRALYARELAVRGDLPDHDEERVLADLRARLADAYEQVKSRDPASAPQAEPVPTLAAEPTAADTSAIESSPSADAPPPMSWRAASAAPTPGPVTTTRGRTTAVDASTLRRINDHLRTFPPDLAVHPKLRRILEERAERFDAGEVDWSLAEALAFGTLVLEGVPVRVVGQDTRRGTFSQRHATLVCQETETEYTPLADLPDGRAPFTIYDSTLSEFAALGFEYGYSVEAADALVCWEAQFGDFANGAQVVIDQYVAAGADKWGQASRLTLLLPHGYEGQGPEHSSARIERFLQLAAGDNLRVAYPSTAAQYFHLLRRQVLDPSPVPLVCFTPKRYLRVPDTMSPVDDLVRGGFVPVLDDPSPPAGTALVLCCTGKVAHELRARRDALGAPVAVVRVEELYPFPDAALRAVLARYPESTVRWVQEEPENMGAWSFVRPRLEEITGAPVGAVTRPASASPATGGLRVHEREQATLLEQAFASP